MKFNANKVFEPLILLILAIIFVISLIYLIKYTIVTLTGLYEPVLAWIKFFINEEKIINKLNFKNLIIFKIFSLFAALSFILIIYSGFSAVFSCIFYKICSHDYKKIEYSLKKSLIKGIKWNFYRLFLVLTPPLSVITVSIILLVSVIGFFNFFIKMAGLSITLSSFIFSFIFFNILFLLALSLFFSLWQLISTIFGIEIAVSEPKLNNITIENRSKKLIFIKKTNFLLAISYLIFIYNIFIQLKYAVTDDFFTDSENNFAFNLIILFNLVCLGALGYLKSSNYIDSLLERSKRISKGIVKVIKPERKNI